MDSTVDIARVDQFSLSLRYVTKTGHSSEHFIKFDELTSSCAEAFYNLLVNILTHELGLNVNFMRGQAYDGASTMSGHISGLQARVKEGCSSKAMYVHCCAHNLNLILIDAVSASTSAKLFFGTLETLYSFLTSSLPRCRILEEEQDKMLNGTVLTLKRLSDTRWASRKRATEAVLQSMPAITEALHRIVSGELKGTAPKVAAEAQGLLTTLDTFEFKLMLTFWNIIMKKTFALSNYLQQESIDLNTALELINTCATEIKNIRSEKAFDELEISAKDLATECNTTTLYKEQRARKKRKHFDELASGESITDNRQRFKVDTFYCALDIISNQFEERFSDFRATTKEFLVLNPKHFFYINSVERVNNLAHFYSEDLVANDVADEYSSFIGIYKDLFAGQGDAGLSTNEVLPFLIANDMQRAFPNLCILYQIYLTIPVSTAQAERSFSRLKLIKNYLRSSMHEDRLSALALLYIERATAENLDYGNVINKFACMKQRKKAL